MSPVTEHPDELLAAYVDGDAGAADRRAVQAHLRSCERCRREADMAERARGALASLPELPAPPGTAFGVLREARRSLASGTAWRVATAVGIAASLIVGVVVLFQRVDLGGMQGLSDSAAERGPQPDAVDAAEKDAPSSEGASARLARSAFFFRELDTDYEEADMPGVAARFSAFASTVLDQAQTDAGGAAPAGDEELADISSRGQLALRCVEQARPRPEGHVPLVIRSARFLDVGGYVPGYIAAYLRPDAGEERLTNLTLLVVERESCSRILYLRDQPIRQ